MLQTKIDMSNVSINRFRLLTEIFTNNFGANNQYRFNDFLLTATLIEKNKKIIFCLAYHSILVLGVKRAHCTFLKIRK